LDFNWQQSQGPCSSWKTSAGKREEDYTIKEREQKNSALALRLIETVENNFSSVILMV